MPFPPSLSRLILRSPNGSRIELDANEATIRMYGINGNLLALLDASFEFAGESIFVQQAFDATGNLVAQFGGLVIKVIGLDGIAALSAGSSGTFAQQPRVELTPTGADTPTILQAQPEADNGGSLILRSPTFNSNAYAELILYSETDGDTPRIDFTANRLVLNNLALGFNCKTVNQNPCPADTETNAAFQLIAGATSLAFTKDAGGTDLAFSMQLPAFATAGGTRGEWGLRYSGAASGDISIGAALFSAANTENSATAFKQVPGLVAGGYTFEPIWRRTLGAGVLTLTASSGTLSWRVQEVREP